MTAPPDPDPKERRASVFALHQAGMTYRQIAVKFGFSITRAGVLALQGKQDIESAKDAERKRFVTEALEAETNQQQALRTISRSLRAELLTRRALAAWSALESQEGDTP